MAKLELRLQKIAYTAGETVSGHVILTCEKKTECKSFTIVIEGQLTAKAKGFETGSKGRTSQKTYTKTYVIHQEQILLSQGTAFDPGTQKFEFQFKLPEDTKVSYNGHNGKINYAVAAFIDGSWRTKLKAAKSFEVLQPSIDFDDKITKEVAEHDGEEILTLEIDSLRYCIGDKISFRYRVDTDMNFTNLKAEVEHVEISTLKGKMPMKHTKLFAQKQIPSDDVIRHNWNKWTLDIKSTCPPFFRYENLQSGLNLKLTIGRSFRFDKSAEIALAAIHCSKITGKSGSEISTSFPEEKTRPTRLKCKKCSYSFKVKDEDEDYGLCPSCGKQIFF